MASETLLNLAKVEEPEKRELSQQQATYQEWLDEILGISKIEDDDDYEFFSKVLVELKTAYKEVEARRKRVTDPLNKALTEFRSWYSPTLKTLEAGEKHIKKCIEQFLLAREEANQRRMKEAAIAGAVGDFDKAHEATQQIVEAPKVAGVSARAPDWDFSVDNVDLVPREWLTVDHSKVRLYLKSAGATDPAPIPGLNFFKKMTIIARTR